LTHDHLCTNWNSDVAHRRPIIIIDRSIRKQTFVYFFSQISNCTTRKKNIIFLFFFHYVIYCKLQIDVRVGPVDIGDFDESAGSCRIIGAVMIRVAS
jgi:hypothetical protein